MKLKYDGKKAILEKDDEQIVLIHKAAPWNHYYKDIIAQGDDVVGGWSCTLRDEQIVEVASATKKIENAQYGPEIVAVLEKHDFVQQEFYPA